jgi:histone-lysine N-methyltransferase SUV420H
VLAAYPRARNNLTIRKQIDETVKRKPGRPRLRPAPPKTVKDEETSLQVKSEGAKHQPRHTNGRFEKKTSTIVKKALSPVFVNTALSRAQRAIERTKAKSRLEQEADLRNRKRTNDTDSEKDNHPRKRVQQDTDGVGGGPRTPQRLRRVLPRPPSSVPGGTLISNPNPLSFALRAWAAPIIKDESSDDEPALITPESKRSLPVAVVECGQEITSLNSPSIIAAPPAQGSSTFKPSPFTFARRRWASVSATTGGGDQGEPLRKTSLPRPGSANDTALDPEEISDVESFAGSDRLSSISSLSTSSSAGAEPSSNSHYPKNKLSSLPGEEVRSVAMVWRIFFLIYT